MLVIDASALVVAVTDTTKRGFGIQDLLLDGGAAPHLIDAEVGQALRRLVLRNILPADAAARSLRAAHDYVTHRHDHRDYMPRAWELRHNVSFYDGLYVALAEATGWPLVTADIRLAGAGLRCDVLPV
ncbi:MAG TPA: type II toxin-antitoxin system VapC family toxin [Acidimicrobiales bacterium]|nr:type II toxin-antitoxin system VapC family toxin [Acidimicrobiales bacterium]